MLRGTFTVRQAHTGGLCVYVRVCVRESESESMSERVCVKTCLDGGGGVGKEGKSTLGRGSSFWLGSFCSASDLISALPALLESLGLGLSGSPVEKVRSGEKKKKKG